MSFGDWIGPMFCCAALGAGVLGISQCTMHSSAETAANDNLVAVVTRQAANLNCAYVSQSDNKSFHTIACDGTMKVMLTDGDHDTNTPFSIEHPECFALETNNSTLQTTALCNYHPVLVHAFRDPKGIVHSRIVRK